MTASIKRLPAGVLLQIMVIMILMLLTAGAVHAETETDTMPLFPSDLTNQDYSLILLDEAGTAENPDGNYYVNTIEDTVTPTVEVRFKSGDGTWNPFPSDNYTLLYEKNTGDNNWETYSGNTFGVGASGETITYRVSATGKQEEGYEGTTGPVEFRVIKKCKVSFDTAGGSSIEPQYVIPGEKAVEPAVPTKEGREFLNWIADKDVDDGGPYWFSEPVIEDFTLYAEWYTEIPAGIYNLSNPGQPDRCGTAYVSQGFHRMKIDGNPINVVEGPNNDKLTFTEEHADGFIFQGWYAGEITSDGRIKKPTDTLLSNQPSFSVSTDEIRSICAVFKCEKHIPGSTQKIKKASLTSDGSIYQICSICGSEVKTEPIPKVDSITLSGNSFTYTGKPVQPTVTVISAGKTLSADYYTVTYSNQISVGTASARVTLKGDRYEGTKTFTYKINPANNPLRIKGKTAVVHIKKLKKKTVKLAVSKVIRFNNRGQGKLSYNKIKGSGKIQINRKTGKITIRKGLKKGTYRVKILVVAEGNNSYKAGYKTVTCKIKVR